MTRRADIRVIALVASVGVLMFPASAAGQKVIFDDAFIQLRSAAGPTGYLGQSGDLFLGGAGTAGSITLRSGDGSNRMFLDGGTADLYLGGGSDVGDILVRDTDGITTTIALRGGLGLVELGSIDEDGDLRLWDSGVAIELDGASGNVTNRLSGDGLVKAWAKIFAEGSAASCFRCDSTVTETRKTETGRYVVDFTPLGGSPTGLAQRPIACQPGGIEITQPIYVQCVWLTNGKVEVFVFVDSGGEPDFLDFPFEVFVF